MKYLPVIAARDAELGTLAKALDDYTRGMLAALASLPTRNADDETDFRQAMHIYKTGLDQIFIEIMAHTQP